jgi:dipeptidase E
MGVVYLGGGGTGQDEALLWERMLGRCRRLLYWPFALEGNMLAGAEVWLRDQLAQRGFLPQIQTWTTLEGKDAANLGDFDLLFVGGGNTFFLLHHLRTHGFVEPVRQWVEAGGNYYGGSAGAILATDSIAIAGRADSNDVGLLDLDGLGLLPAVGLLPHYTAEQQDRAQSISRDLGQPVVGVPEAAGLVVDKDAVETVGPEPVWTVTSASTAKHAPGSILSFTERPRPTSARPL